AQSARGGAGAVGGLVPPAAGERRRDLCPGQVSALARTAGRGPPAPRFSVGLRPPRHPSADGAGAPGPGDGAPGRGRGLVTPGRGVILQELRRELLPLPVLSRLGEAGGGPNVAAAGGGLWRLLAEACRHGAV